MMKVCGKLSRAIMLLSNITLFIASVGLLAVSLWSLVVHPYVLVLMNENAPFWFSIILFLLGGVTFIFVIIGCMGVMRHNRGMLAVYLILGIALFVVTLSGGIICFLFREKADTMWHTDIIQKMEQYDPKSNNAITQAFDEMQIELSCCGIENPDDWTDLNTIYKELKKEQLPTSCCTGGKRSACSPRRSTYFHELGCKVKMNEHIDKYCITTGIFGMSLSFVMLLAVICSLSIYQDMERSYPPTKADI